jgi:hypothetical protein
MAEPLIPVQTIRYKQYVKEALLEALRAVFASHPDTILRRTSVDIDFPMDEALYPAVVVRFYERSIRNAGIGHSEFLPEIDPDTGDPTGLYIKYKHYLYSGDIEFAIYALSSLDRDLVADTVVQVLTMGDLEPYSDQFLNRIYQADAVQEPSSVDHMINLNTDEIMGFGETQDLAPWGAEDVMIYSTSYRIGIFGEFYSRTPPNTIYGVVEKVETYPYMPAAGETQPNPNWSGPDGIQGTGDDLPDPAPWITD